MKREEGKKYKGERKQREKEGYRERMREIKSGGEKIGQGVLR